MGKTPSKKRGRDAPSTPYDSNKRPSTANSKAAAAAAIKNNVFKFNTNVGQHILKNPGIADAIVEKANLKPTDTVLEIGPGTGNISVRILEKAKKLIAIELDPRMAAELTKRTLPLPTNTRSKLDLLLGDAIKLPFPPGIDVCISNTPYQISSPLVFKLLSMQPHPPRCCVLMFQREFALRLTARPGDGLYNRLSVNAQFFAKVTHIMKVGRANFRPPPQVDSSVVKIEPYRAIGNGGEGGDAAQNKASVSWDEFDGLLRIVFGRKNKTIRASFGTKEVMGLVERNYRTYCALNNIAVEEGLVGGEVEVDGDGDGDGEALGDEHDLDMDGEDDVTPHEAMDVDEWGGFGDDDNDDNTRISQDAETTDHVDDEDNDEDDAPAFFKEIAAAKAANQTPKTPSKRKKTKVGELVRQKVDRVLRVTDLADQRAGKLDENAFLKLLYAFHQELIHFA